MAYIKNFEKPETKHQRDVQTPKDNNNPLDNPSVKPIKNAQKDFFHEHIQQYSDFIAWCRFYPDLFLDLIRPETGGINLHFDQRVFLRCICRFYSVYGVFPRGWGKCVSGDTYIYTSEGIVPIKSFFKNEENGIEDYTPKLNLDIINKNHDCEKIDRGVYNGYKDTKKIKTSYGFELECSNNHPIMIEKNGNIDFILASELRQGDKVLISIKNDIWGNNLEPNIDTLNFDYINSENSIIPDCIMRASKDIVIKTMQDIFDRIGIVNKLNNRVSIVNKSKEFIKQIQLILLNLGIVSRMEEEQDKNNNILYVLSICDKNINKFQSEVGFNCAEKSNELNEICKMSNLIDNKKYEENYFLDEIINIDNSKAHVYDISVPETHSFVSNGFISHNTWGEVISMFIIAILYPGITMSLTAQTKANAAELLKDKYDDITRQYPLLKNEMYKPRVAKDDFELNFVNGSRIDVLANSQTSKGQRRNRIQIEESALVDAETFDDALKPIVEIGRTTCGKLGIIDPLELNQQINFFTTSGFRGSDEWARSIQMYKDMLDCKGEIVIGAGWMLGCWMGRGSRKDQILKKKKQMSSVSFARNYEEKWVGAVDNQLVDIKSLLKTRTLTTPIMDNRDGSRDIILGVDVARSANTNNNKTIISVLEIHHANNGLIRQMDLVNMFLVSNQLNFTAQACFVKSVQIQYNAKVVVVDVNGLGNGLRDELLKPNVDVQTGDTYPAWDAINGDIRSEYKDAIEMVYALNSQGRDEKTGGRINNSVIINFIGCVEGGKIRLLEERKDNEFDVTNIDEYMKFAPYEQTNALVEEIANLKIKHLTNGEVTVERVLSKIDKDRYSSLAYALWWAMTYDNTLQADNRDLVMTIASMNRIASGNRGTLSNIFQ